MELGISANGDDLRHALAASENIGAGVSGHREQPCSQSVGLDLVTTVPELDQNLLGDVFGFTGITEQIRGEGIDPPRVALGGGVEEITRHSTIVTSEGGGKLHISTKNPGSGSIVEMWRVAIRARSWDPWCRPNR